MLSYQWALSDIGSIQWLELVIMPEQRKRCPSCSAQLLPANGLVTLILLLSSQLIELVRGKSKSNWQWKIHNMWVLFGLLIWNPGGCASGWTDAGTYCYRLYVGPFESASAARAQCLVGGGDLPKFDSFNAEIQAYSAVIRSASSVSLQITMLSLIVHGIYSGCTF